MNKFMKKNVTPMKLQQRKKQAAALKREKIRHKQGRRANTNRKVVTGAIAKTKNETPFLESGNKGRKKQRKNKDTTWKTRRKLNRN